MASPSSSEAPDHTLVCPKCPFTEHGANTSDSIFHSPYFQSLLASNATPTDHQVNEIRDDHSHQSARLLRLQDEIETFVALLKRLRAEKKHVQHVIDDYETVLNPIRRLPHEIVSSIFLKAAQEDMGRACYTTATTWRLAQISAPWRRIALGFHQLWSRIRITQADFSGNPDIQRKRAMVLALHLRRGGSYPLGIAIITEETIPQGHPIIQTLIPTTPRWEELRVKMRLEPFDELSPLRASLPCLKTLCIQVHAEELLDKEAVLKSSLHDMFQFAPELSEVFGDPDIIPRLALPWHGIQRYALEPLASIDRLDEHSLLHLPAMQTLQACRVVCSPKDIFPEKFDFPLLSELHLYGQGERVAAFLNHLKHAPSLKKMTIRLTSEPFGALERVVGGLTTVEHLALRLDADPEGTVPPFIQSLDILSCFPKLTSVFIILTTDIISTLASPTKIPTLKSICTQDIAPAEDSSLWPLIHKLEADRPDLSLRFNVTAAEYLLDRQFVIPWGSAGE